MVETGRSLVDERADLFRFQFEDKELVGGLAPTLEGGSVFRGVDIPIALGKSFGEFECALAAYFDFAVERHPLLGFANGVRDEIVRHEDRVRGERFLGRAFR